VGHIYPGKVDRYRVTARSLGDGRGGTSTVTFSYRGLGLSSDGKEFRGHSAVRATDPLGHYTDTWFNQDDLLKGRAYHSQTRHRNGSLLDEVTNTWLTSTPYPGVTFARFAQTDMATWGAWAIRWPRRVTTATATAPQSRIPAAARRRSRSRAAATPIPRPSPPVWGTR